jgi:hypothetical protein
LGYTVRELIQSDYGCPDNTQMELQEILLGLGVRKKYRASQLCTGLLLQRGTRPRPVNWRDGGKLTLGPAFYVH